MVYNIRRALTDIKQMLFSNERVQLSVKQSYLSGVSPDSVVVTNKRVIVVHHSFWGLHLGHNLVSRTTTSMTELQNIASVSVEHGLILSAVHMRLIKSAELEAAKRSVWTINGLNDKVAHHLADEIKEAKAKK